MKKLVLAIAFAIMFCICAVASEQTIYVSGFGNDENPGTKDEPLRTVEAAFYALPFGGKLVLQTAVSFPDTSELPESEGLITITSFDGVTDYRTEYSAKIYVGEVLKLRSSIKFEHVDIVATVSNSVIICNGHYTCFGEGINCSTATSNINFIGITGGGASRHPANSSTLEIHSGDWYRVRGGQRGGDRESFDGDIAIAVYGGTVHEGFWLAGDILTNGNGNLFIYGGTFKRGIQLANTKGFSGDINVSIYGGSFEKAINVSNGGNIGGNVTITAFAKTNAEIKQTKGEVGGEITVKTTNPINVSSSFSTYIIDANEAEEKITSDKKFIEDTFTDGYSRHTANTDYAGKALTKSSKILQCDTDSNGYIRLFDVLSITLKSKEDAKALLAAVSSKTDNSYTLYGASTNGGSLCEGYAFASASTDSYKVSSTVTLEENGIVTLFFGCDDNSPSALNGYCFEADMAQNTLSAYEIKNGNYRRLGKKPLALLANKAEIYVEYSGSTANIYFDDNKLEKDQFFDFNFKINKYGSGVGIYVKNASATLPKCEALTLDLGEKVYTNELLYSFTDPDIFCENGIYYIYGSGNGNGEAKTNGINCFSTTDFENFKYEGQVLKKGDTFGESGFLCANIVKYGDYYYMFYSAYSEEFGRSPTACASSKSPTGPFTNPDMKPLTTIPDLLGGQPFVDNDGTAYLIYTRTSGGNQTYGARVILKDGKATLDTESERFLLGVTEEWEAARASVLECGLIVKHGGIYYLLYAGGNYNSTYGVGYATSKNPLGPYTKYENNPIFIGTKQSYGVGAASVFPSADGSEYFIIHLRHFAYNSVRPLQTAMDRFRFVKNPLGDADIIEICGPTVTPQPLPSASRPLSADEWQAIRFHP